MKKIVITIGILCALLLFNWSNQEVHAAVDDGDVNSVMNGLITQIAINQTNKPQFGDQASTNEMIDPASGKLVWERTDIHLPGRDGLDLDIGIMYDSNQAFHYMRQYGSPGLKKYNYLMTRYDLGLGWSFKFPSIQIADGYHYYHTGDGAIYRIDFNATDSLGSYTHLVGYQGKDLKMMRDSQGVFSNGQTSSAYYLEYSDQKRQYFDTDGLLLGIVDRFNNTIKFEHIDRQVYDGETYKVISKITDTIGRTVHFDYETNLQSATNEEFNGERIIVSVKDLSGVQSQQVEYLKWRYEAIYQNNFDGYIPELWTIKNQEGITSYFGYQWESGHFHYSQKVKNSYSGHNPFLLLNKVDNINSTSNFEYELISRNFGPNGFGEEFRVKKRYDQVKKNGSSIGEHNALNISYGGDYTGYPTYSNPNSLPQSYTYFSNSTIQSNTPTNGLQSKTIFNGKGQVTANETIASNGEKKILYNTAYDSVFIQKPTKLRFEDYGIDDTATTSNKVYKDITYTSWGAIQTETNPLLLTDYNNSSIKSKHTVSYTYDPTYYFLKSRSWYPNIESASPSVETYDYYSNGRLKSYTNALNETTSYCYNVLNPNNTTSSNCSNANTAINGKVTMIKVSRPLGGGKTSIQEMDYNGSTSYAYPSETRSYFTTTNSSGQNITNMVKKTMSYYMATGLLKEETDSNSQMTQYQYDTMGRLTKVIYPNFTNSNGEQYAAVDEYAYVYTSVPTSAVVNNRGIRSVRVDYQRKYTRISNNSTTLLSRQSSYYNGFGSLLYDLQNNNGITQISQYEIDDLSRARIGVDPQNHTTTVTFDAWGNQREAIDPYGNLYISEYNLKQRRNLSYFIAASDVSTYRANPSILSIRSNYIEQDFDYLGQLISNRAYTRWPQTNQSISELFSYDLAGNLISYTDPKRNLNNDGVTTRYTYDQLNRLTGVKDALGQIWSYGYDGNNQLTTMNVRKNESATPETLKNNSYTELGGIANKTDNFSHADTYRYNNMHMIEQRKDRNNTEFTNQYDQHYRIIQHSAIALGKPTQLTKSIVGSNGILQDKTEMYENGQLASSMTTGIDHLKRVTSVATQAPTSGYSSLLTLAYDTNNRITKIGSGASTTSFFTNYSYDKLRLDKVQVNGLSSVNSTAAANVKYEYFPNGNLKSITYPPLANGSILKTEYTYDALNRITSVKNLKGFTFLSSTEQTYDDNGNIISTVSRYEQEIKIMLYTYDKLNRLTKMSTPDGQVIHYTYDVRGNRQTDSVAPNIEPVEYEYDLHNKLIRVNKDDQSITFDYSPDGLRYKKTTDGTVKQYRYNQNKEVIAEVDGVNQTIAHYVRGDRLLVKKDLVTAKDYYYLYNSHGDVIQIVDTNGDVKNSYMYDAWGNIVSETETIDNDFKYAGEMYDEETGLYYLRARYYDPSIGRFINEDTYEGQIDNPLSLNLYTYVHNNPLIYIDPTGHFAFLLIPLAPMVAPGLTGLGTLGMGIWVNHELNKDKVVQQPKVEQKPTVIHQPSVVEQKPVVNQQPIVQQKPTVSQQPKVQQQAKVIQQPVVDKGPTVYAASPSNILKGNMIAAGKVAPNHPHAAHHIVAVNDPRADTARKILTGFQIDINSSVNGVFLPTVQGVSPAHYHPSLHTNVYYQNVENELSSATSPQHAVQILNSISNRLQNGTFPR